MDDTLKANCLVFAGPFLGEFGWEISHWAPHVRWLRSQYKGHHIVAASYPGRQPLYCGFINEFWSLPEWFLKEKYELDCFEALAPVDTYGKLLKHFENKYKHSGQFSKIIATRTPRGFNHHLRNVGHVLFDKLKPSPGAVKICNELRESHGNKPCVIIFAREVLRKTYLNIQTNTPVKINPSTPLPTRNWPRSYWEDLFEMLYKEFEDQITFVIGGTKHGNCLLNLPAHRAKNVIDLTNIDIAHSLDVTIAFLQRALCSMSSQSGPTHLSLQTGCPSFIYGHEYERHAIRDNPFKTDVMFFETTLGAYNESPDLLFNDSSIYIKELMQEKQPKIKPKEPIKIEIPIEVNFDQKKESEKARVPEKIKKIGMIGVFDKKGSTNIPFAKAFRGLGFPVQEHNYRTALEKYGPNLRDEAIVEMSLNNDLLIFCKGNGIPPDVFKECAENTTICWYMMDSVEHLQNRDFYEYEKYSHFSVVTTLAMKQALMNQPIMLASPSRKHPDPQRLDARDIHHIIQGVDPDEFYHMKHGDESTISDVVFIGTRSEKRDQIFEKIGEWGYSLWKCGNGYGNFVTSEEFNKVCAGGRVCLAINNTDSGIDSFSDRILRYLATKSFVIAEYSEGLEKYFINGEDLVWFRDLDELKRLLDNFINRDSINLKPTIAETGYKKVIENYTWKHVADKIINIAKGVYDGSN